MPSWLSSKVESESDGILVEFLGFGFGRWKELSLRFDITRKRLSGCVDRQYTVPSRALAESGPRSAVLTETCTSAGALPAGSGRLPYVVLL